jgi:vitamin B12 transporter
MHYRLLIALLLSGLHLQAQDSVRSVDIPAVVISGRPSPRSVLSTPDSIQWQFAQTSDLGRLLGAAGVANALAYGAPGTAVLMRMNGTSPDHATLMYMGIPLQSISLGMADFSLVPVYFFDGASASEAAESGRLANRGIGGEVHLHRDTPLSPARRIGFTAESGSLRNRFWGFQWQEGGSRLSWNVRGFHQVLRNHFTYRDVYRIERPVVTQVDNDGESSGLSAEVRLRTGRHQLRAGTWWIDRSMELPAQMGLPSGDLRRQADRQGRIVARYTWNSGSGRTRLESTAAWIADEQDYAQFRESGTEILRASTRGMQSHVSARAEQMAGPWWRFEAGAHMRKLAVRYDESRTVGRHIPSVFYRMTLLRDAGEWSADFRNEWPQGRPPAFSAWISWQRAYTRSQCAWHLSAGAGRKTRLPDFNELYWQPGGNEHLRNERSLGTRLTAHGEWKSGRILTETAVFHFSVQDWIQWVPGPDGIWSPRNYKFVRSTGASQSVRVQIRKGKWRWNNTLRYEWNPVTGRNDDSREWFTMVYAPLHRTSLTSGMTVRNWMFSASVRAQSVRHTQESGDLRSSLDPFAVADLAVSRHFSSGKWGGDASLRVDNLFHHQYEMVRAFAIPGRVIYFTVSISYEKPVSDPKE